MTLHSHLSNNTGLTIQEHFACEMLKGIISHGSAEKRTDMVLVAIEFADLLIEGLNKEKQP